MPSEEINASRSTDVERARIGAYLYRIEHPDGRYAVTTFDIPGGAVEVMPIATKIIPGHALKRYTKVEIDAWVGRLDELRAEMRRTWIGFKDRA